MFFSFDTSADLLIVICIFSAVRTINAVVLIIVPKVVFERFFDVVKQVQEKMAAFRLTAVTVVVFISILLT